MIIKRSMSVLGLEIVNDIKSFIAENTEAMISDPETSKADGSEMLANAIAYGVAKALASVSFNTALKAGVGPASAGTLISTALQPTVIEV